MSARIPVLKPKLPQVDAILPYLKQIDANRWYGNFGPLVQALEKRFSDMFGATDPAQVTMVANGTLGLTVALQALEIPRGSLCLMPSWTFTATPAAALAAGVAPVFIDIDEHTQQISPARVKAVMKSLGKPIGVVMPVSPFGAPVDVEQWDRFTEETGIPVVIDAAAAFDSFTNGVTRMGRTPVMVSLHATKICGIGEGGLLLTTSGDIAFRIRRIINFGFENDRLSHRIAINAKPSEYNAAVGMAVLDNWKSIRSAWKQVQDFYTEAFAVAGIRSWMHPDWVTGTCNILVPGKAPAVARFLREAGIETRRWWETGCHAHPAYRGCLVAEELSATQYLGQTMLGLPGAMDLAPEMQRTVCEQVLAAAKSTAVNEAVAAMQAASVGEIVEAMESALPPKRKAGN